MVLVLKQLLKHLFSPGKAMNVWNSTHLVWAGKEPRHWVVRDGQSDLLCMRCAHFTEGQCTPSIPVYKQMSMPVYKPNSIGELGTSMWWDISIPYLKRMHNECRCFLGCLFPHSNSTPQARECTPLVLHGYTSMDGRIWAYVQISGHTLRQPFVLRAEGSLYFISCQKFPRSLYVFKSR